MAAPQFCANLNVHSDTVPFNIHVTYRVRCDTASIAARARAIAVEQSVEMPVDGDRGRAGVERDRRPGRRHPEVGDGTIRGARLRCRRATVGGDAGQLMNMLFGNTSIHDDVGLHDAEFPDELSRPSAGRATASPGCGDAPTPDAARSPAPRSSRRGFRPTQLAELARRFADGGIDYIKDDHGLADQAYSPFAARVAGDRGGVARDRRAPLSMCRA